MKTLNRPQKEVLDCLARIFTEQTEKEIYDSQEDIETIIHKYTRSKIKPDGKKAKEIMELTRKYLYAKIGENLQKIGENHG